MHCHLPFVFSLLAALILSASAKEGSKTFYVTYVGVDEGWNANRYVVQRFTQILQQLNKEHPKVTWTLALPRIHQMTHIKDIPASGLSWGDYVNKEELSKIAPVIDFTEYEKLAPIHSMEAWWLVRPASLQKFQGNIGATEPIPCKKEHLLSIAKEIPRCFSGASIRATRCFESLGVSSSSALKQQIYNTWKQQTHDTIIFVNPINMNWDPDTVMSWKQYKPYTCHLRPATTLVKKAQAFINKELCPDREKMCRFCGVHLRRGDFLVTQSLGTPSIEEVANQLREVQQKHNFGVFFIATDGSQQEMTDLKRLLGQDMKLVFFETQESLNDLEQSIIEQIVAASSSHFLGTQQSTYSRTITEYRDCGMFHKKPPPAKTTYNAVCSKHISKCNLNYLDRWIEFPQENPGKRQL